MPGARYFIWLMLSAVFYNTGYSLELGSNTFSQALMWFNLEHIAIPIQHYLWFMISLEYVGLSKKTGKILKYVMLIDPALYYISFFTNNLHHLFITSIRFEYNGYFNIILTSKGPLYISVVVTGTITALMSLGLYIRGYIRSSQFQRYGYVVMIISSLFPWVSVYFYASNSSFLGIDYFPVVCIISGILYMFGIFKLRIFNTIPIATETVFRQSKDGILLIDLQDQIIDVNASFLKIYPELTNSPGKRSFTSFILSHPQFKDLNDKDSIIQYSLEIDDEIKCFSAKITKILTDEGMEIGKILTLNDVTLFVENQKRLEAIASDAINSAEVKEISYLQVQLKPHFINNTLSTISAMISRSPNEAKNLIMDLSEYLFRSYSSDNSSAYILLEHELETVDVYVSIEKARFRERLNFEILAETTPPVYIPRFVLQPLIENAIRHGVLKKIDGGNVFLKISSNSDAIFFEISDDGVGIPEGRIEALLNGQDSRQGVAIVNIHKRLVKCYGKGLKIISKEGQGTTVCFSVPVPAVNKSVLQEQKIND